MSESLYEMLIEATDFDPNDDNRADVRRLLKAMRKTPPEITDAKAWRAAIDQALAEADRLDALWLAAKVEDWTARWPQARREIEKAGATVREIGEGLFAIDIGWPNWCEIDLTRATLTSAGQQHVYWRPDPLDAVAQEAASAIAAYEANRAKAARLRALHSTHAWDRKAKHRRPKYGAEAPVFESKVTLADYEAATSDRPQSV